MYWAIQLTTASSTLGYAVAELQKDVEDQLNLLPAEKRAQIKPTEFAIFVGALQRPSSDIDVYLTVI